MEKLIKRFKSFTWNHILLLVLLFLFEIVLLWFLIGMSITLSKNMTLFGGSYGDDTISKVPGSFDYTVLSFVVILNVVVLFLIVFYLFISKVVAIGPVTKEIVKGKTIYIEKNKQKFFEEQAKKDTNDNKDSKK